MQIRLQRLTKSCSKADIKNLVAWNSVADICSVIFLLLIAPRLTPRSCLRLEGHSLYTSCKKRFKCDFYLFRFLIHDPCIYFFKGATKSYFTHYSFVVFILFNTGLCKSAFSTNSFRKLFFYRSALFVFSACYVSNLM